MKLKLKYTGAKEYDPSNIVTNIFKNIIHLNARSALTNYIILKNLCVDTQFEFLKHGINICT